MAKTIGEETEEAIKIISELALMNYIEIARDNNVPDDEIKNTVIRGITRLIDEILPLSPRVFNSYRNAIVINEQARHYER